MGIDKRVELKKALVDKISSFYSNPHEWNMFLSFAGRLNKYDFLDQVTIFIQRPTATACETYERWNDEKLSRWIKKGSKGIALIEKEENKIKYVFDISDTVSVDFKSKKRNEKKIESWEVKNKEKICFALCSMYGLDYKKEFSFEENLHRVVKEHSQKNEIMSHQNKESLLKNTLIEKLPYSEMEKSKFIENYYAKCITISLVSRCGGNEKAFRESEMTAVTMFCSQLSMITFGTMVQKATQELLFEIETIEEEEIKNEQKQRNTFAESRDVGGERPRNIRENEISVFEGRKPADVYGTIHERGELFRKPLYTDKRDGTSRDRKIHEGNSGEYERRNARQRNSSDRVGRIYEQSSSDSKTKGDRNDSVQEEPNNGKQVENVVQISFGEKNENYNVTDEPYAFGGAKARFKSNIKAIEKMKELEGREEARSTQKEKETLAQYVGWGGLSQVFDEKNNSWGKEREELKQVLTEKEYEDARASVLTAFYTPIKIVDAMYKILDRAGFEKGNICDPACGTGVFFGMLPEKMKKSKLFGVELDTITGKLAKELYPGTEIQIKGYEDTDYKNNSFDVMIGNVPFGSYKVFDPNYNKYKLAIHDYFFTKSLDQLRPGGLLLFVTSQFTLDKKTSKAREILAEKANFLGAIRLPNTSFKESAATEITSDIIILQKKEYPQADNTSWIQVGENERGITLNEYFVKNPHMILGTMENSPNMYGDEKSTTCVPLKSEEEFEKALNYAVNYIDVEYKEKKDKLRIVKEDFSTILPADTSVKNYSYTIKDGIEVYYRENDVMIRVEKPQSTIERIKGMHQLSITTQQLIELQLYGASDAKIKEKQETLNNQYDKFTEGHGLINSSVNKRAFSQDSSYYLLCSLENLDDKGKLKSKSAIFKKRTIGEIKEIKQVESSIEALAVSLNVKGKVVLEYMQGLLTGKSIETMTEELNHEIYHNPETASIESNEGWETADEYLSGNIREKIKVAKKAAEDNSFYEKNVKALENVIPPMLQAKEIDIRLGATWIEPKYITEFIKELLELSYLEKKGLKVEYAEIASSWNVTVGEGRRIKNVLAETTFGTKRKSAYEIIDDTLNLKISKIYDTVEDVDGNKKKVLNQRETVLVRIKQEKIKEAFKGWIFKDSGRRTELVKRYNELFNSERLRTFDGTNLTFGGMNPLMQLRKHQKDAVARTLYGGNTLLAHTVGAGKTFVMAASVMELKRMGLIRKAMIVVPNHLTGQIASEFYSLYSSANLLVATKEDFKPANRKKFCSRIAAGDYDAVIIGHSQFEKIPLSEEFLKKMYNEQIETITDAISSSKKNDKGQNYSVKQMEKTKKSLKVRLQKLNESKQKDDVISFEQTGVDKLYIDEAHYFKNLFLYTKMRNVAGISQTEAMKSSDMYNKGRYLDIKTKGRGLVFATGTPISNSMTEMYTMQRYLQYDELQRKGLGNFDAWASTFGETTTSIELAPEGKGYRTKTRFAKFYNLPELMTMFKKVADIQTSEMLNLPIPELVEGKPTDIVVKPSTTQKEYVELLAERAETCRGAGADPRKDNMLKITSDGRKLALDQRLINSAWLDEENSKVNKCVENIFNIWEKTEENKSTQLVFCDLSTPKKDGTFNVYDDLKNKLIERNVPAAEIAFIHEAETDIQKELLFSKVRDGNVRILVGSTVKMGAGTNVQNKLAALHHLDVPWRPSDIEQREGRMLRQGNENKEVEVFRYVTEGTFDAYSWQLIERKQSFISQIMTHKTPMRSCEDIDETTLSYAEIKMLATGNPYIKEKMDLDLKMAQLKILESNYKGILFSLKDQLEISIPKAKEHTLLLIEKLNKDRLIAQQNPKKTGEHFSIKIRETMYNSKEKAGERIRSFCLQENANGKTTIVGNYRGFEIGVMAYDDKIFAKLQEFRVTVKGVATYSVEMGSSDEGIITRLDNCIESIEKKVEAQQENFEALIKKEKDMKAEVKRPFEQKEEYEEVEKRLSELNLLLDMDNKETDAEITEEEKDTEEKTNTEKSDNFGIER